MLPLLSDSVEQPNEKDPRATGRVQEAFAEQSRRVRQRDIEDDLREEARGVERPYFFVILFQEPLVDGADRLDGDEREIVRPKGALAGLHRRPVEEVTQRLDVIVEHPLGFVFEVVAEQVAIEVSPELLEQRIERRLRPRARLRGEDVPEMARVSDVNLFQVFLVDHFAVEQIAGEDEPTKKCVQHPYRDLSFRGRPQLLTGGQEVVQQVTIDPLRRVERFLVTAEIVSRLHGR